MAKYEQRDFSGEFRQMMIDAASRDNTLVGYCEHFLFGYTDRLTAEQLDDITPWTVEASLTEHYGLEGDDIQAAIELCESRLLEAAGEQYQQRWQQYDEA